MALTHKQEEKLNTIAYSLKDFIEKYSIKEFYIGKTDNLYRRKEEHKAKDALRFTKQIAIGESIVIGEAEKFLINYFTDYSGSAKLLNKKGSGGEGNPSANILYISFNQNTTDESDPFDDEECFSIVDLPINL